MAEAKQHLHLIRLIFVTAWLRLQPIKECVAAAPHTLPGTVS